ncbi:hypothetical protein KQI63_12955 [bacterium]|nr:hypothetical protein [bacterium]
MKGRLILAQAIIWGVVIIFCSILLIGTDAYPKIQGVLGAGAVISLFAQVGIFAADKKKQKEADTAAETE